MHQAHWESSMAAIATAQAEHLKPPCGRLLPWLRPRLLPTIQPPHSSWSSPRVPAWSPPCIRHDYIRHEHIHASRDCQTPHLVYWGGNSISNRDASACPVVAAWSGKLQHLQRPLLQGQATSMARLCCWAASRQQDTKDVHSPGAARSEK